MVNQSPDVKRSEVGIEDEIDEILSRVNPNPRRRGCPAPDVLQALARRERPIGDPGYEHLAECSACYQEFRLIQRAAGERPTAIAVGVRSRWLVLAAAAAVIVVVGLVWLTFFRPLGETRPNDETALLRAELDLRKFATVRSDQPAADADALSLPATLVRLSIMLPVGSEAGPYDVEVLDEKFQSRATTRVAAEIRDYIATLEATLDLRQVPAGSYQLAIRRQGDSWRRFPATVR